LMVFVKLLFRSGIMVPKLILVANLVLLLR